MSLLLPWEVGSVLVPKGWVHGIPGAWYGKWGQGSTDIVSGHWKSQWFHFGPLGIPLTPFMAPRNSNNPISGHQKSHSPHIWPPGRRPGGEMWVLWDFWQPEIGLVEFLEARHGVSGIPGGPKWNHWDFQWPETKSVHSSPLLAHLAHTATISGHQGAH